MKHKGKNLGISFLICLFKSSNHIIRSFLVDLLVDIHAMEIPLF
jgi:hypothetical protein